MIHANDDTPHSKGLLALTLLMCSALTIMAGAAVAPALPSMAEHFDRERPGATLLVRLILTLPALFIALGAPFMGILLDKFGRKRILVCSLLAFGIFGGMAFLLASLEAILVSRAALGIVVAGLMTSCSTLIGDHFEGSERDRIIGLQGAFMSFGGVGFILASTFLVRFGWREPFLIYLVAFALVPLAVWAVPEPVRQPGPSIGTDVEGAPLPWATILVTCGLSFLGMVFFYMIPVQLPFLANDLTGGQTLHSGLVVATSSVLGAFSATQYHRLRRRLDVKAVAALVFILMAAGYSIVGLSDNIGLLYAGVATGGLGLGMLMPNLALWLMSETPEAIRGRVVGALTTSVFLGQFLSPLIVEPAVREGGVSFSFRVAGAALLALGIVLIAGNALAAKRQLIGTAEGPSAR